MEEVTLWNIVINSDGKITQLQLDGKSKEEIIMKVIHQYPNVLKTATSISAKESFKNNSERV